MRELLIKGVDSFTTKPFSGNPAGVVTEADGLPQYARRPQSAGVGGFVQMPGSDQNSRRTSR